MVCREPALETCISTGVATVTCGNRTRKSAILTGAGAPVSPTIFEEPGGSTITSAPIPAWRERWSFNIPTENPTISRIRVTSRAMATTLMPERKVGDDHFVHHEGQLPATSC